MVLEMIYCIDGLCLCWPLDLADLIYDIVADCSDNVPTRYLVNDACVLSGKPLVSSSALRMEGQVRSKYPLSKNGNGKELSILLHL